MTKASKKKQVKIDFINDKIKQLNFILEKGIPPQHIKNNDEMISERKFYV